MSITKLVLIRHGQSNWNKENKFTGWHDVDLSPEGHKEAEEAGKLLKSEGYQFDYAYTSVLTRAIHTLGHILDGVDQNYIPVQKSWRLNERHYGDLQGKDKAETAKKFGDEQVKIWRRAFAITPPPLSINDPRFPGNDPRYKDLSWGEIPTTESLALTIERVLPFWESDILPRMKTGQRVVIAAHGNSLRALVKYLDKMTEDEILAFNIPTAVPMVYEFDESFRPLKRYYLGDQDAIAAKAAAVANQGKAK